MILPQIQKKKQKMIQDGYRFKIVFTRSAHLPKNIWKIYQQAPQCPPHKIFLQFYHRRDLNFPSFTAFVACLEDEAAEVIASLETTPENYTN